MQIVIPNVSLYTRCHIKEFCLYQACNPDLMFAMHSCAFEAVLLRFCGGYGRMIYQAPQEIALLLIFSHFSALVLSFCDSSFRRWIYPTRWSRQLWITYTSNGIIPSAGTIRPTVIDKIGRASCRERV